MMLALSLAFLPMQGEESQAHTNDNYNIIEINVERLPDLNIARTGHMVFYLDGGPVVFGGHTDGFVPTPTAEYLQDGEWHTVPLSYPHDHGTIIKLRSGKVFLAGGHKESLGIGQLFATELYDPGTHTAQGFGCMEMKRAFANAAEIADGQVIISGNWFSDDGIEMFENVYDSKNTNAVKVKDVSVTRAMPYILRISDDDAIIFSSLDDRHNHIDYGIVDRLKGDPYIEPFLDTWHPIRTIVIPRSYNQFIGNEEQHRYEWLLPVVNDESGEVAIAIVKGISDDNPEAHFSLLPTEQPIPLCIQDKSIIYSTLICDREREIAYLIGNDDDEGRIYVVAINYNTNPSPLTVYVTEPQPFLAKHSPPVLTPEGDLIFAGGQLISNFFPTNAAIKLPLGKPSNSDIAATTVAKRRSTLWLWIIIPCILAGGAIVAILASMRKNRQQVLPLDDIENDEIDEADDADFDKALPKDEFLAELFKRIEQLMDEEKLFLNANLRTSDVAVKVGSNNAYVSAAINTQCGCSFSQFLISYRISYAQELMRKNPDTKISSVSTMSGFSTDSTFFRAFRSITGMSPKEWLSEIHDNKEPYQ